MGFALYMARLFENFYILHGGGVGLAGRFAVILEHSGLLKKPELESLPNPRSFSREIMTPTKKRKACN